MERKASGRFVLRLPRALHARLRLRAAERGVSLNALCVERLGDEPRSELLDPSASRVVEECISAFGDDLRALVLFGSLARGEDAEGSDADLLVVLGEDAAITRALYRRWEQLEVSRALLLGRPVSPQFVALPREGSAKGGLWYEVALDGAVLWDRGGGVRRLLAALRREILSGEVEEGKVHGQRYWIRRDADAESSTRH